MGKKTCVKIKNKATIHASKCSTGYECSAGWLHPSQATDDAHCMKYDDKPLLNYTVPGDYWTHNSECFGMQGEVFCINNQCISTRRVGSDCPDVDNKPEWKHKWCPTGMYWGSGNTCYQDSEEGEVCDKDHKCKFGYNCIKTDASKYYQWVKMFSVEVGHTAMIDNMDSRGDIFMGYNSICENYNAVKTTTDNVILWEQADVSKDKTIEELRRKEGNGQVCEYTTAKGDAHDFSKWGFNSNSDGWCTKRKGDKWFIEAHDALKTIKFEDLGCHVSSDIKNWVEFVNLNTTILADFKRAVMETDYALGFANFAENDNWVKNSITKEFWQNDFPNFASSFEYCLLIALAILAVIQF